MVNVPLLVATVVVVAVLAGGAYWLHGRQVRRLSAHLLDDALQAQAEEDWPAAKEAAQGYLQYYPDDADALHVLFDARYRLATTSAQRVALLPLGGRVLAADPEDVETAIRVAELQLASDPAAALAAVTKLRSPDLDDPRLTRIEAHAAYGRAINADAWRTAEQVVAVADKLAAANTAKPGNPTTVGMMLTAALRLRQLQAPAADDWDRQAREAADVLVDSTEPDTTRRRSALLLRVTVLRALAAAAGDPDSDQAAAKERWLTDVRHVLDEEPTNLPARLLEYELTYGSRPEFVTVAAAPDGAKAVSEELLDPLDRTARANPRDPRAYRLLAAGQWLAGHHDAALTTLTQALRTLPREDVDTRLMLADMHGAAGHWQEAGALHLALLEELPVIAANAATVRQSAAVQVDVLLGAARFHLAENNPLALPVEADRLIERAHTLADEKLGRAAHLAMTLGEVYRRRGQWTWAAQQFRAAAQAPELELTALARLAAALRQAGDLTAAEDAQSRLLAAAARRGVTPDRQLLLERFRAELDRQRRLPAERRDFDALRQRLATVERAAPDALPTVLARVDALVLTDGAAAAAAALRQAQAPFADDMDFWTEAFSRFLDWRDAEGLKLAQEAVGRLQPDSVPLLAAQVAVAQGQPQVALAALARVAGDRRPEVVRTRLFLEADVAARQGRTADAVGRLLELLEAFPQDTQAPTLLAALAAADADPQTLTTVRQRLEQLEGPDSAAVRLLKVTAAARDPRDGPALTEAGRLAEALVRDRPDWEPARLALALVREAAGDWRAAANAYENIVRSGSVRATVLNRWLAALLRVGRTDDAVEALAGLPDESLSRPEVVATVTRLLADAGQGDRAERIARDATTRHPREAAGWLALARLLGSSEETASSGHRRAEAGGAYRQAVALVPARTEARLLALYDMMGRSDDAGVREGYLLLGDLAVQLPAQRLGTGVTEAVQQLVALELVARAEGEWTLALDAAGVLQASDRSPERIDQVLGSASASLPRYQRLMRLLTAAGAFAPLDESIETADRAGPADQAAVDEYGRLLLATLSARTTDRRITVESLATRPADPVPSDRLLLADLQIRDGDLTAAAGTLRRAIEADGADDAASGAPELVDRIVWLAETSRDPAVQAQAMAAVARAATIPTTDPSLVGRWRLSLAAAAGDSSQVAELFRSDLEKDGRPPTNGPDRNLARFLETALVVARAGLDEVAAEAVRARLPMDTPNGQLTFARWAISSRVLAPEAWAQAAQAAESDWNAAPTALLTLALMADPPAEHAGLVERAIATVLATPGANPLRPLAATVRERQGRTDEAIAITRETLARDPDNAVAHNNLAWQLATASDTPQDAYPHIAAAIRRLGPMTSLLDTLTIVHAKNGHLQPAAAVAQLGNQSTGRPTAPMLLHEAWALDDAGEHATAETLLDLVASDADWVLPFNRRIHADLATGR